MKCKFNKEKAKSALKKAGSAVRGLERFIMESDKYFKSLSKKETDSVQKDMLRFITSTKARSLSMRGGEPPPPPLEEREDSTVTSTEPTSEEPTSEEPTSEEQQEAAAAAAAAEAALHASTNAEGEGEEEGIAPPPPQPSPPQEEGAEAGAPPQPSPPPPQEEEGAGAPVEQGTAGGSAFGLQPNSRTGILYSALWLATFCLSGGNECKFTPGMLEVMPCCSKWSVLVKPLVENAKDLHTLNLIGLKAPNAYARANSIFNGKVQSFYGMSMNRSRKRFKTNKKKVNFRKTKRVRKNKTRKR